MMANLLRCRPSGLLRAHQGLLVFRATDVYANRRDMATAVDLLIQVNLPTQASHFMLLKPSPFSGTNAFSG